MHVAFHFQEDLTECERSLTPLQAIERAVLTGLLDVIPRYRQHVRVRSGNPGQPGLWRMRSDKMLLLFTNLLVDTSVWKTVASPEALASVVAEHSLAVQLVEGISPECGSS